MLGYPVSTVADLLADPQLQARDFWRKLPLDAEREATAPGGFAIVDGERLAVSRAPRVGEHNEITIEKD
jgi:crotonobetainyl-CoA:carnitine CoA-transferase CaiB-like acyl-CoA transferase